MQHVVDEQRECNMQLNQILSSWVIVLNKSKLFNQNYFTILYLDKFDLKYPYPMFLMVSTAF